MFKYNNDVHITFAHVQKRKRQNYEFSRVSEFLLLSPSTPRCPLGHIFTTHAVNPEVADTADSRNQLCHSSRQVKLSVSNSVFTLKTIMVFLRIALRVTFSIVLFTASFCIRNKI